MDPAAAPSPHYALPQFAIFLMLWTKVEIGEHRFDDEPVQG